MIIIKLNFIFNQVDVTVEIELGRKYEINGFKIFSYLSVKINN